MRTDKCACAQTPAHKCAHAHTHTLTDKIGRKMEVKEKTKKIQN